MFILPVGETGTGGAGGGESRRFKVLTDMTVLMSEIQVRDGEMGGDTDRPEMA